MTAKRRALLERRKVVGYTQEKLGVERSTVQRWETGETCPQPWCGPKLAKALMIKETCRNGGHNIPRYRGERDHFGRGVILGRRRRWYGVGPW